MQALATVTTVFTFVAIAIHVYIWIIESFLWTKPKAVSYTHLRAHET